MQCEDWDKVKQKAKKGYVQDPTKWLRGVPQEVEQLSPLPPEDYEEVVLSSVGSGFQEQWKAGSYYTDASGGLLTKYEKHRRVAYSVVRLGSNGLGSP
eukprot:9563777-Lingulodinium_polyedra.AAC.1